MASKKDIEAYLAKRARPNELKTVTVVVSEHENYGLTETVTLKAGWCPCSVCGHDSMLDCERADCKCCSSTCT